MMHVDAGPRNGDESHAVNRIANCSRCQLNRTADASDKRAAWAKGW